MHTHCMNFYWMTFYLQAALPLRPPPHITHPVTEETLSCLKFYFIDDPSIYLVPFTPTHLSSVCQLVSVALSKGLSTKRRLPFEANW